MLRIVNVQLNYFMLQAYSGHRVRGSASHNLFKWEIQTVTLITFWIPLVGNTAKKIPGTDCDVCRHIFDNYDLIIVGVWCQDLVLLFICVF